MTAIDDLIEHVESGEGADRALENALCQAFIHDAAYPKIAYHLSIALYSLDAVVSLIEQILPGADWKMHAGAGSAHATIGQQSSYARTPSRALLAATLRAIKEQSHGA